MKKMLDTKDWGRGSLSPKNLNAPGVEKTTADIVKDMGEVGVDLIHKLCSVVWINGRGVVAPITERYHWLTSAHYK